MVRIETVYQGGLRVEATHVPSGTSLLTDAPVDNHGRGESFSPTDLVATALGSCMATIMGIVAERHGVDLSGMRVTVVKHMVTTPERRIGKLVTVIHVPMEPEEPLRRALELAARACPVHRSLRADLETPVTFRWGRA